METDYIIFSWATLLCLFPTAYHCTNWRRDRGRELLVAKLLIEHINNKATGMLNMVELLEAYPSDGFRWNWFG